MICVGPLWLNKTNCTFEIHVWGHHANNESSTVLLDLGTLEGSSIAGDGAPLRGILALGCSQEDKKQTRRIKRIG